MNWSKTLIAGVVSGIALTVYEFIVHAKIMASTYAKYPVFAGDGGLHFVLVAVCVAIAAAILFSKTRGSWADGPAGGATFGFFLGLFVFFGGFYRPLIFEGFPYYLAWCQGSITLIAMVIVGAIQGAMIKK